LGASTAARRIAVLGEMLELGDRADDLHADVGRAAANAGIDALFVVGGSAATALADAAIAAGMDRARVRHFGESGAAASAAVAFVRAGDVVLETDCREDNQDPAEH